MCAYFQNSVILITFEDILSGDFKQKDRTITVKTYTRRNKYGKPIER